MPAALGSTADVAVGNSFLQKLSWGLIPPGIATRGVTQGVENTCIGGGTGTKYGQGVNKFAAAGHLNPSGYLLLPTYVVKGNKTFTTDIIVHFH